MKKLKYAKNPVETRNALNNQSEETGASRRTRRFKRKPRALKEIKRYQNSVRLLISKSAFSRLAREIMDEVAAYPMRIQSLALNALQEAAEMYITQVFEDALLCTIHAKRVTLMPTDIHLMRRLRGPDEVGNK